MVAIRDSMVANETILINEQVVRSAFLLRPRILFAITTCGSPGWDTAAWTDRIRNKFFDF